MNRTTFLARIRAAVDVANGTAHRRPNAASERIAAPPKHPLPACAKVADNDRASQFARALEARGAIVSFVEDLTGIPAAVEPLIARYGSPLLLGRDPRLTALPWTRPTELWDTERKPDDGTVALTHALAGVAETGTLVLASGPASPTTLAFLPETHVAVLSRSAIVGSFEAAFGDVTAAFPGRLPRAINLISGPSRTGDIGGRIVLGAHGPNRLIVVVYGSASETAADRLTHRLS